MKTILLPVDFSAASLNAARYAAGLAKSPEYEIGRIILLNSFHVSLYEQILPTPDLVQTGAREILEKRGGLKRQLDAIRDQLLPVAGPEVEVEIVDSDLPLLRSILKTIEERKPDLLVIGSNSPTDSPGSEIGEYVIGISRISPVHVLVVPGAKTWSGINRVVLPCDYRNLGNLTPLRILQDDALWQTKTILVINADPTFRRSTPDEKFRAAADKLNEYLRGISHEIHYADDPDTLMGILRFARDQQADLILALPGKHSVFYSMTHKSISKALCKNGQMPVLILK